MMINDTQMFSLVLLPLLIFFARILDVSLGTLRIVFISRGMKFFASFAAFFEVLIWLLALGEIMKNLTNPVNFIAYSAGYAAGNFMGIYLEEKIAVGMINLKIITTGTTKDLLERFRMENFGFTINIASGAVGDVTVISSVLRRRDMKKVNELVKKFAPEAFVSVEDIRTVDKGIFPPVKDRKNHLKTFVQNKRILFPFESNSGYFQFLSFNSFFGYCRRLSFRITGIFL